MSTVGPMLRDWRERRRLSQQSLSDLSAVSTRHLSRVETSRAHPSAEMILHLAEHLEVPLQDRNRLLLAGGYAPQYGERPLTDDSLAVVMAGLRACSTRTRRTRPCCSTTTGTWSTRTPPPRPCSRGSPPRSSSHP
jgi:transcriptional regulator with XRE-family HTH domain